LIRKKGYWQMQTPFQTPAAEMNPPAQESRHIGELLPAVLARYGIAVQPAAMVTPTATVTAAPAVRSDAKTAQRRLTAGRDRNFATDAPRTRPIRAAAERLPVAG
jgi:hypothetical protein